MLILLSPAKSLDYATLLPPDLPHTRPAFPAETRELVDVMRTFPPQAMASLMHISDALATLNTGRYADFRVKPNPSQTRAALFAFNGDVYEGLNAHTLDIDTLHWAQNHVAILSGLYGVLRPFDEMQPYRLEMGTKLVTCHAHNLYAFWGESIARHLNKQLQEQGGEPLVVNLASVEYFKSVDRKALRATVAQCVFEEWHGGAWKVISFYAKRARGCMARFALEERAETLEQLKDFKMDGYRFAAGASLPDRLVFRRRKDEDCGVDLI